MSDLSITPAPAEAAADAASGEVPVRLAYKPGLTAARPMLWHSGLTLPGFYSLHVLGAMIPITAGLLLYGWRGLALIAVVTMSAGLAYAVWGRIGGRGHQMRRSHAMWLALLLALMLPVHAMTSGPPFEDTPGAQWAILVGAGVLVTALTWLLDGAGSGRVHPVLVAYLLLVVIFKSALVPHWVLQKNHLFLGDVRRAERVDVATYPDGWRTIPPTAGLHAVYEESPAEQLTQFTSGQQRPDRKWLSVESLLRDEMPPLEDLILGGQPGPVGASCAIAVIVGGLFLLYRGVIDFRIPLLIYLAAFAALLVLPIPAVIQEVTTDRVTHAQVDWRWVPVHDHAIGGATAVTFANYEVMAGPLLFMAFFLATAPEIRPITRRGRFVYALLIGALAAGLQLYVSVSFGPYLALLVVSLLTPMFDRMFHPKCLV